MVDTFHVRSAAGCSQDRPGAGVGNAKPCVGLGCSLQHSCCLGCGLDVEIRYKRFVFQGVKSSCSLRCDFSRLPRDKSSFSIHCGIGLMLLVQVS